MSRVFRFHLPTAVAPDASTKVLRKRKSLEDAAPIMIAADSSSITDGNGTRSIYAFRNLPIGNHVTLTRREADHIALANPGTRPPDALEDMHPWIPRRPYLSNSKANFRSLNSVIHLYGQHLVTAAAFCDAKWNTICNSVRLKNDMDARFYTAWHLPIQDVFILEETRADRSVVAIDFNGMYAACMQQPFPKPSELRFVRYGRDFEPDECLPIGLYRCVLKSPATDFIRKYNPFRSFLSGRQLQATLSEPVEVDLNEFEIEFYRRHFKQIHLVDAVICDQSISHPLAREARRSFSRRKNYRMQGNKPLADREKYLSTLMSSCSHRPSRSRLIFGSQEALSRHLSTKYGICPNEDEPDSALGNWLGGRKGITVTSIPNGLSVDAPDLQDGSACFLFNQRIVARGRVVILETMEKISSSIPDVEICYVNIDSIQFSVSTVHLTDTLGTLRANASEEMGSFKIEAITRHGLWLEPGRYWLYSDTVEKFRNRSVGDRRTPFKDHGIHVSIREIGGLHFPIRTTVRMTSSMSPTRAISLDIDAGLARQSLIEICESTSFASVLDQLEENRRLSIAKKMRAFDQLRDSMGFT